MRTHVKMPPPNGAGAATAQTLVFGGRSAGRPGWHYCPSHQSQSNRHHGSGISSNRCVKFVHSPTFVFVIPLFALEIFFLRRGLHHTCGGLRQSRRSSLQQAYTDRTSDRTNDRTEDHATAPTATTPNNFRIVFHGWCELCAAPTPAHRVQQEAALSVR